MWSICAPIGVLLKAGRRTGQGFMLLGLLMTRGLQSFGLRRSYASSRRGAVFRTSEYRTGGKRTFFWNVGRRLGGKKQATKVVLGGVTSNSERTLLYSSQKVLIKANLDVCLTRLRDQVLPWVETGMGGIGVTCFSKTGHLPHRQSGAEVTENSFQEPFFRRSLGIRPRRISHSRTSECGQSSNGGPVQNNIKMSRISNRRNDEIGEKDLRAVCSQVPDRIRRVVAAKGGYIQT